MASRPILPPYSVIINGAMSADITSIPTVIQNISMVSYDISWAGSTPVGSFTVEVSNSYSQNVDGSVRNPGNWTALTLSSTPSVSGNTGSGFIDIDQISAYAIRLRYTRASGTGVMQAIVTGKVA